MKSTHRIHIFHLFLTTTGFAQVVGIFKSIKTCPDAYAIFETEAARDAAVDTAVQSGGVVSWR